MKTVYLYHPDTKEYISPYDAQLSPLHVGEAVYLVPEYSTEIPPPAHVNKTARVFIGAAWKKVPDFRGTEYWIGADKFTMSELGALPVGFSDSPPPPSSEVVAEQARVDEIDATTKGDPLLAQLSKMSKAEYNDWWTANITDWASFKPLARKIVGLVLRRLF
jgi:hypothetical protein